MAEIQDNVATGKDPRDVLADRIDKWTEESDRSYDYADALISDLDKAGYAVVDLDQPEARYLYVQKLEAEIVRLTSTSQDNNSYTEPED